MQIADSFNGGLPPAHGGVSTDLASQLRQQRMRQQRILRLRALAFWWYPVVLILLGSTVAIILANTIGLAYPLQVNLVLLGLPFLALMIRKVDFSLLLFAIFTTAVSRALVTIKGIEIFPCQVMMAVVFCTLLVQAAFHAHKVSLPPLRAIWPQLALFVLGIISNVMVQFTWTHGVPHKINSNPIIYDEILGCVAFTFPLIVYVMVTMIVALRERYIKYIQRIFILLAICVSAVVLYDFRRIGGDIYTFRFSEPHIFWMSLRAIAQLLALGAILAYARFLYATTWPQRVLYCVITILCLGTVVLTLENSWWLEAFVALIVMTIIYSWRLISFYITLVIPFTPLLKAEYTKLQAAKSADSSRLIIWQDALRVWSKQPVLGVGPGNFWAYDQTFTNLPKALRNCNATGLCVAHNGYLQILGEQGPLGLFFFVAFPVVMIVLASLLYRRAYIPRKYKHLNFFASFAHFIGLDLADLPAPKKKYSPLFKFRLKHFIMILLPVLIVWRAVFASPAAFWHKLWAIFSDDDRSERHIDRMLALSVIGLTFGSMVADFFAGGFFIPPRQISIFTEMPQVATSWILWAFIMYRDQQWRKTCRQAEIDGVKPVAYPMEEGVYS